MARFKVVITDFDYGDNAIERGDPRADRRGGGRACRPRARTICSTEPRDCDAIMNQYARVGAKTIAAMQRCQVIARYGVGVDIVDVEAATPRNILVTNVRDYCTEEVADHAIALWLTLARKLAATTVRRMTASGTGKSGSPSIACADGRWASSPSARSARPSPSAPGLSASSSSSTIPIVADDCRPRHGRSSPSARTSCSRDPTSS